MIFEEFLKSYNKSKNNSLSTYGVSIYPISEYNLEGIKILLDNSIRMGSENNNVEIASICPSIWMGSFFDKYWDKISYATPAPVFTVMRVVNNKVVMNSYTTKTESINNDEELDTFFKEGRWKKFVLFSVTKYADLRTLQTYYTIKYADITEKYEVRDNKIDDILKSEIDPNDMPF